MEISFIGMETQKVAIRSGVIKVVLKTDVKMLEEVGVTSYGTFTKRAKRGEAFVTVDIKAGINRKALQNYNKMTSPAWSNAKTI